MIPSVSYDEMLSRITGMLNRSSTPPLTDSKPSADFLEQQKKDIVVLMEQFGYDPAQHSELLDPAIGTEKWRQAFQRTDDQQPCCSTGASSSHSHSKESAEVQQVVEQEGCQESTTTIPPSNRSSLIRPVPCYATTQPVPGGSQLPVVDLHGQSQSPVTHRKGAFSAPQHAAHPPDPEHVPDVPLLIMPEQQHQKNLITLQLLHQLIRAMDSHQGVMQVQQNLLRQGLHGQLRWVVEWQQWEQVQLHHRMANFAQMMVQHGLMAVQNARFVVQQEAVLQIAPSPINEVKMRKCSRKVTPADAVAKKRAYKKCDCCIPRKDKLGHPPPPPPAIF